MQHLHVERIHHIVVHVKPAVRHHTERAISGRAEAADAHPHRFGCSDVFEIVVSRQHWLSFTGAQVGKHQAVALFDGIPGLPRVLTMAAAIGLAWLVQTTSLRIEQPTVITAADAVGFDAAVIQTRTPMHTAGIEHPGAAVAVPEQHQLLAQNPHFHRQIAHRGGSRDRLPVAAHELTARGAGPHLDERFVEVRRWPAIGAAVAYRCDRSWFAHWTCPPSPISTAYPARSP